MFDGVQNRPLMAMVEITNRCNMECPVCFTAAHAREKDNTLEEVMYKLDQLMTTAGVIPVQISGGEPTLHPQLPEIVGYAKGIGFKNIELVTNGIAIGSDTSYLSSLVERGLTAVYLQFDGLKRETHEVIRGRDMREVRNLGIEAIRKVQLCCTLAVAVVRGVNDCELGEIVRFGVKNIDTVRAINFQSATRFQGRFSLPDSNPGYSVSELVTLLEAQSNLPEGGFLTDVLGHPECNALSLVYSVGERLEPLFRHISKHNRERFLGQDSRQVILDLFMGKDKFCRKYLLEPSSWKVLFEAVKVFGVNPSMASVLRAKHILLFVKSFMECSSLDSGRLAKCCYGIAGKDGIYSFCAYNNLYRNRKERENDERV